SDQGSGKRARPGGQVPARLCGEQDIHGRRRLQVQSVRLRVNRRVFFSPRNLLLLPGDLLRRRRWQRSEVLPRTGQVRQEVVRRPVGPVEARLVGLPACRDSSLPDSRIATLLRVPGLSLTDSRTTLWPRCPPFSPLSSNVGRGPVSRSMGPTESEGSKGLASS